MYIGGLPFELSEGDIITIFSQFGEPVHINLVRDKETGKSKGFAFLKYEDQRSTDLAVDNLGGAVVMGRVLRVDHTNYKKKEDEVEKVDHDLERRSGREGEDGKRRDKERRERTGTDKSGMLASFVTERPFILLHSLCNGLMLSRESIDPDTTPPPRPILKEERELADLMRDHDDDDPMKAYLVQQKREEVDEAIARLETTSASRRSKAGDSRQHRHRHSRKDRSTGHLRTKGSEKIGGVAGESKDERERRSRRRSGQDIEGERERRHRSRSGEDTEDERHRKSRRPAGNLDGEKGDGHRRRQRRREHSQSEERRVKLESEDEQRERKRRHRDRSHSWDDHVKDELSEPERDLHGTRHRHERRDTREHTDSEYERRGRHRGQPEHFRSRQEGSDGEYQRQRRPRSGRSPSVERRDYGEEGSSERRRR